MAHVKKLLPNLDSFLRKGSCGKIAIIGGSEEYTGAPIFSALSALRLGADLVHIYCAAKAVNVIKTFSPDFIVHSYEKPNLLESFERIDAFVIGPGLGRGTYCPLDIPDSNGEERSISTLVDKVVAYAAENDKPVVIDGDALWFVSQNPNKYNDLKSTVLTPNIMEFSRLAAKVLNNNDVLQTDRKELPTLCSDLASKMGITIFLKGETDIVAHPNGTLDTLCEKGSPRRCGGQGDTSAGTLGVFLLWALRTFPDKIQAKNSAALACSQLIKMCAFEAFEKLGRSMTTSDLINQFPQVLKFVEKNTSLNKH